MMQMPLGVPSQVPSVSPHAAPTPPALGLTHSPLLLSQVHEGWHPTFRQLPTQNPFVLSRRQTWSLGQVLMMARGLHSGRHHPAWHPAEERPQSP